MEYAMFLTKLEKTFYKYEIIVLEEIHDNKIHY